jgi:hypothetical protein
MPERLRKRVRRNVAWPGTWTAEGRRLEEGLGSELALALLATKKDCERHRCVCLSASLADSAVVSIITEILEGDGTKRTRPMGHFFILFSWRERGYTIVAKECC